MFAYKILVPIKKIKNDYEHIIQQNFKNNILERKSFLTFKIYAMSKILLILKFLKQQTHKVCEYFCLLKRKKKKNSFLHEICNVFNVVKKISRISECFYQKL